jgi:hypothetical protein
VRDFFAGDAIVASGASSALGAETLGYTPQRIGWTLK